MHQSSAVLSVWVAVAKAKARAGIVAGSKVAKEEAAIGSKCVSSSCVAGGEYGASV